MSSFKKHMPAHLGWLIITLFSLLVINVSVDVADDANLTNIISTAVGITSLVLAVVAIGQSLLSSFQATETARDIKSAVSSVALPVSSLQGVADELRQLLTEADRNYKKTAEELSSMRSSLSNAGNPDRFPEYITLDAPTLRNGSHIFKTAIYISAKCVEERKHVNINNVSLSAEDKHAVFGAWTALTAVRVCDVAFSQNEIIVFGSTPAIETAKELYADILTPVNGVRNTLPQLIAGFENAMVGD